MNKKTIIIIFIVIILLTAGLLFYQQKSTGFTVNLIYTSELMGSILDLPCNKAGSDVVFYTIPQVMEQVDSMKAAAGKTGNPTVYLDAGNTLFGVDYFSESQGGKPALELLSAAGCEALVPGDAEFKYGIEKITDTPDGPEFFTGNIAHVPQTEQQNKKDNTRMNKYGKYYLKKTSAGDIAVFSLFEPYQSPFLPGVGEKYENVVFSVPEDSIQKQIDSSTAKIKILIARVNNPSETAVKIKGVDLIIPARYDDDLNPEKVTYVNNIAFTPFVNSRYQGPASLIITKGSNGRVSVKFSTEKPKGDGSAKIAAIKKDLELFYSKYGKNYDKVNSAFLGYGNESLTHTTGDARETAASFVMADMIRSYARSKIAIINLFSIRRTMAGIIRGEDVEWIAPFGNKLVTMDLTGSQIEELMKLNNRRDTKFLVMSGASVKYEQNGKISILIDGEPLSPNAVYRVATNDYLSSSDKPEYAVFRLGKRVNATEIPINGIFLESLLKRKYLGLPPERIGHKTRQEVESISNPAEKASEAYKWGFFDIAYKTCTNMEKQGANPVFTAILNDISVYCGIADGSKPDFHGENKNSPAGGIFKAVSEYLAGNTADSLKSLKSLSDRNPSDIRLKRLSEAVAECSGTISTANNRAPLWGKFKGDSRNTGRSSFRGPSSKNIRVVWKYQTYYAIKSSPAAGADGTIYFGGGDGIFYALDPEGKLKWNYTLGGFILSSPAVDNNGTIYVGSDEASKSKNRRTFRDESPSTAGYINAINPDGTLKWRYKTGGWTASSPAIMSNGNIVVGSNDSNVYCISPEGKLVWKVQTGGKVFSSPAIDEKDTVYIGSEDCNLYAISKEGGVLWKFKAENKFFSSPLISDQDLIYAGNDDSCLYVINKEGKLQRKQKLPAAITSTPSQGKDGDIYAGCEDGCLYRISADGKIKWKFEREDEFFSSPIIDKDGYIYIGCEDNCLYCVSPEGKMVWRFETGDYVESTPVISKDGRVYLGAEDKFFYAIENAR